MPTSYRPSSVSYVRGEYSDMSKLNDGNARYIQKLLKKGGPDKDEYDELNAFFVMIGDLVRSGSVSREEINRELWKLLGDACSLNTMQGRVVNKPCGYAGDYETIDKIYTCWTSPYPQLIKWDYFFHSQSSSKAVRNRIKYFMNLLNDKEGIENNYYVLSVASGPARDVYEFCSSNGIGNIHFECVDMDPNAISYSMKLCQDYHNIINFHCKNIFRCTSNINYYLIWAAGLFDYLEDKTFIFLLKRLYKMVAQGGCLVIGNFSQDNPCRDYIEAGDWFLFHRNKEDLISLARKSGIEKTNIIINSEPLGINLFMHLYRT